MDFSKWLEWAGRATAASLLAGIIATGQMGLWVYGWQYNTAVKDRDEWKALTLRSIRAAEVPVHAYGALPPGTDPQPAAAERPIGSIAEAKARVDALEREEHP